MDFDIKIWSSLVAVTDGGFVLELKVHLVKLILFGLQCLNESKTKNFNEIKKIKTVRNTLLKTTKKLKKTLNKNIPNTTINWYHIIKKYNKISSKKMNIKEITNNTRDDILISQETQHSLNLL